MKEPITNDKVKGKEEQFDLQLHQTILKQQELLLKQQELIALKKEEDNEIDLSVFLPSFLKKKTTDRRESYDNTQNDSTTGILPKLINPFVQNYKLILLFTLFGLIAGVFSFQTSQPVYRSELTLQNGGLDNTFFAELITPLEKLSMNKDFEGLSSKLEMDSSQVRMIHSISYKNYLYPHEDEADTSFKMNERPFFHINVQVLDTKLLPELEQSLIKFLLNNKYVQEEKRVLEESLQASALKLKYESVIMDSLRYAVLDKINQKAKDNSYFVKESGLRGGIILSQDDKIVDPLAAYDKSMKIFEQEQEVKRGTTDVKNLLSVANKFVAYKSTTKVSSHNIPLFTILGLLLGIVAAFLLYGIKAWKESSVISEA